MDIKLTNGKKIITKDKKYYESNLGFYKKNGFVPVNEVKKEIYIFNAGNKITNEENSVIWWSNAFHTVNAQYVRGLQGVKDCYNKWLNQIKNKNPDIWILGKDYLDKPVEGKTLKSYLNEYNL